MTHKTRQEAFDSINDIADGRLVSGFSEFANDRSLLTFMCKSCPTPFKSTAHDYTSNQQCSKCNKDSHVLYEQIRAIHGDYYDYDNLVGMQVHPEQILKVRCPKHGLFDITVEQHVTSGKGCPHCLVENVSARDDRTTFVNDAHHVHNFNYRYDKVTDLTDRITVTCPKHGDFDVDKDLHIKGQGCSICSGKEQQVISVTETLDRNNIVYSTEKTFPGCVSEEDRALRFDIFVPQKNIVIEFDGVHHFSPTKYTSDVTDEEAQLYYEIQTRNDQRKHEYCEEHGIGLVRIPYTEYNPGATIEMYLSQLPDKRKIHSWQDFELDIERMVNYIKTFNYSKFAVYGVSRGGVPFAVHISNHFEDACEFGVVGYRRYDGNDKQVDHQIAHASEDLPIFIIDDLISSGITMRKVTDFLGNRYPNAKLHPIVVFGAHNEDNVFYIREHPKQWIVFPYEV